MVIIGRYTDSMQTVRSCIAQARSQTFPNADSTPPNGGSMLGPRGNSPLPPNLAQPSPRGHFFPG